MTPVPGWIHLFLDVPRAGWADSVAFWSAATGWEPSAPRGEAGHFVTLDPASGDGYLKLQATDDDAPRVHLHLDGPDRAAAIGLSIDLGASVAWEYRDVQVMRSPGGLLFCHTLADELRRFARADVDRVLDQVCLDIPAPLWDREVEFWHTVTGRELEVGLRPEFAFLGDPDAHGGLRILLQRLNSTQGQVRAHPDFAVAYRPQETARQAALGAQVVNVMDRWTVMRAPDQHVYCLTDRDPSTGRVRR